MGRVAPDASVLVSPTAFVCSTEDEMSSPIAGATKSGIDRTHTFELAFETPTKEVYECTGGCGVATCRAREVFQKSPEQA